ncbi:hypothetical protein AB0953_22475 [Streptomyces sp. NPDC046866]|uniref:SCO4225 family membrane protein n=1 Tax=Streptomyces sp. NPDC046866 TaxID=3154921 RepID=UPI0034513D5E
MPAALRTFARLAFGNRWSGSYLGLAAFFLLFGFAVHGSYVGGLLGGLLGMPTVLVVLTVAGSLGSWAQGDAVTVCLLVFAYTFQAFLLGLLVRTVRSRKRPSGAVRSGATGGRPDRAG